MEGIPYCGLAPFPGGAGWNLDPALLGILSALGGLGAWGLRVAGWARQAAFGAGWLILTLALVSPLCSLSVALFSARVGQHLVVTLVAAPLLAFAAGRRPLWHAAGVTLPALAFAVALWAWHLPNPYAATFRSDGLYWLMHLTLAGSAVWLWAALFTQARERPDAAGLAGLATAVQMGLLGALLTLAPRPLFAPHAASTAPWGLTALEDQQLGGLLMWVPGGLVFAAVMVLGLALALRPARMVAR